MAFKPSVWNVYTFMGDHVAPRDGSSWSSRARRSRRHDQSIKPGRDAALLEDVRGGLELARALEVSIADGVLISKC